MNQFCTICTAINTIIHQNVGIDFLNNLLFQKLSKGIMKEHPLDSKYDEMWDFNILIKQLSPLWNSMEIETRTENKNKEQRKNKLGSMSFIKCVPKAKKNKRKFILFHPQMGPKNKTSFVQKRTTNNLQLFTIRKHTQNSSVFPLTNKTTKSTKPTITIQHPPQVYLLAIHNTQ